MKPFASLILLLLLALPMTATSSYYTYHTMPAKNRQNLPVPDPTGYIVDQAEILSPETEQALTGMIEALDKEDSTQLAVLTIPTLKGDNLEMYALAVAETWGVGQKGKDNGALLLIAQKERKVRIEVGYGLEGRLTDLLAGRIIRNEITPRFKEGDFDGGVRAGVEAMIQAVKGEHQATTESKTNPTALLILDIAGLVFLAYLVLVVFGAFREASPPPPRNRPGRETARTRPEDRPSRREQTDTYVAPPVVPYRSSSDSDDSDDSDGSSGSSFGGFGGGRFGGGGASGGW